MAKVAPVASEQKIMSKVKTRYAPSPTGHLHLGGLRTALFNWLWARREKGQFILRLEDTDQERLVPGAAKQLMSDLQSLGLDWDFGPDKPSPDFGSCVQSHRLEIYRDYADQLIQKGIAYYDYTSPEELKAMREQAQKEKQPFVFRKDMAITEERDGRRPVVRIAVPDDLQIDWQDTVKGEQGWQGKDIGDFVAVKSDGWPTYHLANVIDDHLMEISHVIRADEWLSSTPKHLYLFDCLGWDRPQYVHVPPVLAAEGGQKLSKRDKGGRVVDLLEEGYLQEAVLNYLSLLGWNPKTPQEVFTVEELVKTFDIANIQVSGARFDGTRLDWFNGQHLRALPETELRQLAEPWWPESAEEAGEEYKNKVLELVYQRLKKWSELAELTEFFFSRPKSPSLATLVKESRIPEEDVRPLLEATLRVMEEIEFTAGNLELRIYQLSQEKKISPSKYFTLLRLKLTGRKIAPGLFATMDALGLEECRVRLLADS